VDHPNKRKWSSENRLVTPEKTERRIGGGRDKQVKKRALQKGWEVKPT